MEWAPDKSATADADESKSEIVLDVDKPIMKSISEIYQMHVKAMEAQLDNDPLAAEKYINQSVQALQQLMDEYPDVESNRRFNEIYRSVLVEHKEFYGIEESQKEVKGEIFEIQEEVFAEDADWVREDYSLPENVDLNKTEVPLVQNRQVNRHLMYYTMRRPEVMEVWLERSEKYFPMMREIFKEEGTPTELIHLAMIESGLLPTARSHAAAVGMWQFIQATGSMYGLEVNWWIDERKDPEKATRAAARHLSDLYNVWGDWHLAMANYNVSPRRLKRAIRYGGGEKDYWSAYSYLPRETRGYVPGFIAATMISMNPEAFGFKEKYGNSRYRYDVVEVEGLMALKDLAGCLNISEDSLREYNPELLRWATPPGGKYPLKIPSGNKEEFLAAYEELPKEDPDKKVAMHVVKRGQTLGYIARKYGTSVRGLFEVNENLSSTIHPGQKIVVPLPAGSNTEIASSRPSSQPRSSSPSRRSSQNQSKQPANTDKLYYRVKKGDTIGHIAEWYDTRAWKIRSWNNTSNYITPGDRLVIYVPEDKSDYYRQIDNMSFAKKQSIEQQQDKGENVTENQYASTSTGSSSGDVNVVTYTVRPNDTLTDIADSFNTSVPSIKSVNDLRSSRIYVGQKLNIPRNN